MILRIGMQISIKTSPVPLIHSNHNVQYNFTVSVTLGKYRQEIQLRLPLGSVIERSGNDSPCAVAL